MTMSGLTTGLVWDETFMWHEAGRVAGILPAGYPVQPGAPHENSDAKRRIKNLLDASGLTEQLTALKPREATEAELLRVHTPDYLARLAEMNKEPEALAGLDGYMTRGGYDIARLATGGVLRAVEEILSGRLRNAYALVRPIGHHAEPDTGIGFCLLSHPSLAARHALAEFDISRVAIVDIDVHHGNGAERAFWNDPSVLTISLHQDGNFPPDSGQIGKRGDGEGFGSNINVPLPAGCGWGAYEACFKTVVLPALRRFRPEFIIVPCGYDAGAQDPLGRMLLYGGAYAAMTTMLMEAAEETAQGRLLFTHEGGYNSYTVPFMGLRVIETLSGISTGVEDPHEPLFSGMSGHELLPHQEAAIAAAAAFVGDVPA